MAISLLVNLLGLGREIRVWGCNNLAEVSSLLEEVTQTLVLFLQAGLEVVVVMEREHKASNSKISEMIFSRIIMRERVVGPCQTTSIEISKTRSIAMGRFLEEILAILRRGTMMEVIVSIRIKAISIAMVIKDFVDRTNSKTMRFVVVQLVGLMAGNVLMVKEQEMSQP
jgi:hypothetical protein